MAPHSAADHSRASRRVVHAGGATGSLLSIHTAVAAAARYFNAFNRCKNSRYVMSLFGYKSLYKKRTGGQKSDGCAIAYRWRRFTALQQDHYEEIEFHHGSGSVLDRDNVGESVHLSYRHR